MRNFTPSPVRANFLPCYSVNPLPFSFRQGGKDGKWGIWCTLGEDLELLINSLHLCESLDENGLFSHFFLPEGPDRSELPPIENLFIEDPPCVAETYIWEFRKNEFSGVALSFERDEYILGTLDALQALYRHAVIDGKETAYLDNEGFAQRLLHARATSSEYLDNDIRKKKFQKRLRLPVEPFHATLGEGSRMTLGIGGRERTFSLADVKPDLFRHELEHLVFHDETSFYLEEPPCSIKESDIWLDGDGWKVFFQRVPFIWELREESILFITLCKPNTPDDCIVGFCHEADVLKSLCGVFRERYPKVSIGQALKRHLRELR